MGTGVMTVERTRAKRQRHVRRGGEEDLRRLHRVVLLHRARPYLRHARRDDRRGAELAPEEVELEVRDRRDADAEEQDGERELDARAELRAVPYEAMSGWSSKASGGVERRRGRGLKAGDPGRRDTPGSKVLKDRRPPRQRGRMGTSV